MRIGIELQRIFTVKKYGIDRVCVEMIKNLQQIEDFDVFIENFNVKY